MMTGSRVDIRFLTVAVLTAEDGSITISTVLIVADFEEATFDELRGPTGTLLGLVIEMDPATTVILTDPWKISSRIE
jgi:hypothetical protein